MSQDDIERAYRTLNLTPDASPQDVVEARDKLLAQWDPDRLPQYSGLREKAQSKIIEIREAFELLIKHTGGSVGQETPRTTPTQARPRGNAAVSSRQEKPSASLFDEVFSPAVPDKERKLPILPLAGGAMLIVVLGLFYLWPIATPDSSEVATAVPNQELQAQGPPPAAPEELVPPLEPDQPTVAEEASKPPASPEPVQRQQPPPRRPAPQSAVAAPEPSQTRGAESPPPPAPTPPPISRAQPIAPSTPKPDLAKEADVLTEEPPAIQEDLSEKAFRSLLENSEAARQLTTGEVGGYRFLEWKVVQEKDAEIWIDLLVRDAGGRTVHFIWSINLDNSQVVPLSQAARNLDRSG